MTEDVAEEVAEEVAGAQEAAHCHRLGEETWAGLTRLCQETTDFVTRQPVCLRSFCHDLRLQQRVGWAHILHRQHYIAIVAFPARLVTNLLYRLPVLSSFFVLVIHQHKIAPPK